MEWRNIAEIFRDPRCEEGVVVKGWVKTRRDSKGGFSFIELNDGSCQSNLQIVAEMDLSNYTSEILKLHPGSSISVKGEMRESEGKGQKVELKAHEIEVHGFCEPEGYPLQKQRVSFEKLREVPHLRPRTNTFGAVTRVRNHLAFETHCFFQKRKFYYLNTPIITSSDCEGAGQMFRVSTINPDRPPKTESGKVDFSRDFFGKATHLTVSGQLDAEAYACSMSKVYTFGPTFRAENSNTSRHLSEFWMVEPEMAFFDLNDDAKLAEEYVRHLMKSLLENQHEDMEFFDKRVEKGLIQTLDKIAQSDFVRMTYSEAVSILESAPKKFEYPVSWGVDLQSEHERYLTEEHVKKPVVLTDYPKGIKAFYMRLNEDNKTVAAMDVLLPKIGEIIGGSQREERLEVLEKRMVESDVSVEEYKSYLDLRRYGTVPHAGFGLGFERMVQFCTGMANIRDVIPFPRTPRHA